MKKYFATIDIDKDDVFYLAVGKIYENGKFRLTSSTDWTVYYVERYIYFFSAVFSRELYYNLTPKEDDEELKQVSLREDELFSTVREAISYIFVAIFNRNQSE